MTDNENAKYVGGKEASKILSVHQRTLYQWDAKGKIKTIRTPGGKRLYDVSSFIREKQCEKYGDNCVEDLDALDAEERLKICYARVSSVTQKDALERQKEELYRAYPEYQIIVDVGSGLDLNKPGIRKIITWAITGKIEELVVTYNDRLTRFCFELIHDLIKEYSNGKITVLNVDNDKTPQEEILEDVMQIMNVSAVKINVKKRNRKKKAE